MMRLCPLCGRSGLDAFTTRRDKVLYAKCPFCGYISRDPSFRMSAHDEQKRYRLHENRPDDPGYLKWLNKFLNFALKPVPRENGRILDFGSGPEPVMAELLRRRGWQVDIEDVFFAPDRCPGPFTLITAVEVFEHLADPKSVLEDLAGRLEPDGRLCISTEFLPACDDDFE
ncbi:MAG: methyltransferase domain-containing protein, partial [Spirochaetaceae bacterium]|nr:methyltransferase domain-containing protein [Spirochaetaceae bacterium]